MKKVQKIMVTFLIAVAFLSATPISTHAQSDGGGPWDHYVYSRVSKAQKAKVDQMKRQMGSCVVKSIYNAVAFRGISLNAAIQAMYNIGSCHGFNKNYGI
ncbi:hypothetical protein ACX92S_13575 (plasmid) [Enterococcus faecalis]